MVAGRGDGRGVPWPRPLPKKRTIGAGVEAVDTNFTEFLVQTAGTDVFDEGGGVGKQVISGEVGASSHVPAKKCFGNSSVFLFLSHSQIITPARHEEMIMKSNMGQVLTTVDMRAFTRKLLRKC